MFTFLFGIFLIHQAFGIVCPNGTVNVPGENVCIYYSAQAMNFADATRFCRNTFGGLPLKVQSVFDNVYGATLASGDVDPFIGVVYMNGTYKNVDGTPLSYVNWAKNEPHNPVENPCATVQRESYDWKSVSCDDPRPFLCSITIAESCPSEWFYNNNTGFCYYLQNFTTNINGTWNLYNRDQANASCYQMGGNLVSIHSQDEDYFLQNMVVSNIANETDKAPFGEDPCYFKWVWIGLYGNGKLGNENGQWTDHSTVDYTNAPVEDIDGDRVYFGIVNDLSCNYPAPGQWGWFYDSGDLFARFLCKKSQ